MPFTSVRGYCSSHVNGMGEARSLTSGPDRVLHKDVESVLFIGFGLLPRDWIFSTGRCAPGVPALRRYASSPHRWLDPVSRRRRSHWVRLPITRQPRHLPLSRRPWLPARLELTANDEVGARRLSWLCQANPHLHC